MRIQCSESLLNKAFSTWIKGFLTLLIILGHDAVFTESLKEYGVMSYFYLFHIQSFFLLPFLYGIKGIGKAKDTAVRFYWPYFCFVTVAMIVMGAVTSFANFDLGGLLRLYAICDSVSIRQMCGLQVFWFLPAMMSTMLLKDLYYTRGPVFRWGVVSLSIGLMACTVYANTSYEHLNALRFLRYLPLGGTYAMQMLGIGVVFRWIMERVVARRSYTSTFVLSVIGFITCSCLYIRYVAFTISVSDLNAMYAVLQLITPLFFMTACVCALKKWDPQVDGSEINKLGLRSLYVYLISPFVGYLIMYLSRGLGLTTWWFGLLMWPVITGVGYLGSFFITDKIRVRLFPRNTDELKRLFKLPLNI